MNYNVKELRDKLKEKVTGLGIDSKFNDNPAFDSALSYIDGLIDRMNMSDAIENVNAFEDNGKISFSWSSKLGDKYSMVISCAKPNEFKCISTAEKNRIMQ